MAYNLWKEYPPFPSHRPKDLALCRPCTSLARQSCPTGREFKFLGTNPFCIHVQVDTQ